MCTSDVNVAGHYWGILRLKPLRPRSPRRSPTKSQHFSPLCAFRACRLPSLSGALWAKRQGQGVGLRYWCFQLHLAPDPTACFLMLPSLCIPCHVLMLVSWLCEIPLKPRSDWGHGHRHQECQAQPRTGRGSNRFSCICFVEELTLRDKHSYQSAIPGEHPEIKTLCGRQCIIYNVFKPGFCHFLIGRYMLVLMYFRQSHEPESTISSLSFACPRCAGRSCSCISKAKQACMACQHPSS